MKRKIIATCIGAFLCFSWNAQAQDQDAASLYDMSLEELLSMEIYSVSKKAESLFDAPLSSSIVTREEIQNSGATTIEEVFRLIPGMIVREETNGNFDIHIRGLDNVPPGAFTVNTENVSTLVMIDGRRVYNAANGGTFWETLPVSLTDIDRIEVIRGPAQALYGPNAASGVINIITTKKVEEGNVDVNGTLMAGNIGTAIASATVGSQVSSKLNIMGSVNYDSRDRSQTTYYNYVTGQYVDRSGIMDYLSSNPTQPISNYEERYQNESLAKDRFGFNAYGNYEMNDEVMINVALSYQDSKAQQIFFESTQTPLTTREANSFSADVRAAVHGLTAQISHINGQQNIAKGNDYIWDFNTTDITLEYDFFRGNDKLSIRPGLQYQANTYDDEPAKSKLFNASQDLNNLAYFVKADYNVTDNFRLVAALRNDTYNEPSDSYFSYNVAATYKLNDKNIVRAVASRAYRGSTIAQMFLNFSDGAFNYMGNTDLRLQQIDLYELGIRNKIGEKVQTNFEFFYSESTDFSELVAGLSPTFQPQLQYQNYPTVAKQTGVTAEVTFVPTSTLSVTAFGTYQSTDLEQALRTVPDPTSPLGFSAEPYDTKNERTPSFYGGAKVTWRPVERLSLYSNLYYFGANKWVYFDQIALQGLDNVSEIAAKARVDLKVSYNAFGQSSVFFNARNLLNNDQDEFGWSDKIPGVYLIGVDLRF